MTTPAETKPCPACQNIPCVQFNNIVWQCYCANPRCSSQEATTGASSVARHTAIQIWNSVIVPSVTNTIIELYEQDTKTN